LIPPLISQESAVPPAAECVYSWFYGVRSDNTERLSIRKCAEVAFIPYTEK